MDDYTIEGFNGLSSRHPLLAFAALIFLLSLTGIPLTAGFQAKFWVVAAATENGKSFWIVPAALLFAAVGAYYYFRVIQAMYFKPAAAEGSAPFDVSFSFRLLLILTILLILVLGVYPEILIGWIYHI
jgi:NADH-quinone oxidoreductase subunit N